MIPSLANVWKIAHLVAHAIDGYSAVYVGPLAKYALGTRRDVVIHREDAPFVPWLAQGVRSAFDEIHSELMLFRVHLPAYQVDGRRAGDVGPGKGLVRVLIEGARKGGPGATTLLLSTGLPSVAFHA